MSSEINFELEFDNEGIVRKVDSDLIQERIKYWANTSQYSLVGYPEYGHRLQQFIHSAPTDITIVQIEFEIRAKLIQDIPYIKIKQVNVKATSQSNYQALIRFIFDGSVEEAIINFVDEKIEALGQ